MTASPIARWNHAGQYAFSSSLFPPSPQLSTVLHTSIVAMAKLQFRRKQTTTIQQHDDDASSNRNEDGEEDHHDTGEAGKSADLETGLEESDGDTGNIDKLNKSMRSMANDETRATRTGSGVVYAVLAAAAVIMTITTYLLLSETIAKEFESDFYSYAREVSEIAEKNVHNAFQPLDILATTITSHSLDLRGRGESQGFPNVTIPHFDMRVEEILKSTGIEMLMYIPFVEQDMQEGWEAFINAQLAAHVNFHEMHGEDEETVPVGHSTSNAPPDDTWKKIVPCDSCETIALANTTLALLVDEEGVMEIILGNLGFDSFELKAPVAQFGPVHPHSYHSLLCHDLFAHPVFKHEFLSSLEYDVPVLSEAINLDFLLAHSYQEEANNGKEDYHEMKVQEHHPTIEMDATLRSFTLNPIKESFEDGARTIGFVAGVVPWITFFDDVLASSGYVHSHGAMTKNLNGLVVNVRSDCGTTFTLVLNSDKPTHQLLGDQDELYRNFQHYNHSSKLFWKDHPKGLSKHCHFDLHIYPSDEFYSSYETSDALVYSAVVASLFLFTAILFAFFDRLVVRRQNKVVNSATALVLKAAQKTAQNERELNDFIAHEVRNPLAAAMSACSFVKSAVSDEANPLIASTEQLQSVEEDLHIIDHSLHFINDLLRNMLDMHRASSNEMKIENRPTHLMDDVFRPIANMLHVRGSAFKVELDCQVEDLVVMTDPLRLKQILLNLSRNSVKFVERGFIRLRCRVENSTTNDHRKNNIVLSVEDSGPGIPEEKRDQLFGKFQETLDTLSQGTGIGLNLCKRLSDLMGAQLYIDDSYDSGVPGCPGTRFVFDMQTCQVEFDDDMLMMLSNHSLVADTDFFEGTESSLGGSAHNNKSKKLLVGSGSSTSFNSSFASFDYTAGRNEDENKASSGSSVDTSDKEMLPRPLELPTGLNVLFVDDDMVLRKLFARSLKKIAPGWNIKEAANGETAIQMVEDRIKEEEGKEDGFDLIFMDQYMASVQKQLLGTETVRALRSLGVTSRICGLSANDVETAFLEAGANSFMFKPFPCKPDLLKDELLWLIYHDRPPHQTPQHVNHHTVRSSKTIIDMTGAIVVSDE